MRRREGSGGRGSSGSTAPQSSAVIPLPPRRAVRVARSPSGRFWFVAAAGVAALLVWGLQWRAAAQAEARAQLASVKSVAPRPPVPEYGSGGASARPDAARASVDSPRPHVPVMSVVAANGEPALQKHRYALLGTTVAGDRRMALLREIVSGESRVVGEGDQLGGTTVAVVEGDRVLLRSGGKTEELQLRMDSDSPQIPRPPEPSVLPKPPSTGDAAADALQAQPAQTAPSTSADVSALLEQGQPVPNPE
jgi:hypothetical protein